MDAELKSLAAKIDQLVALCQRLRAENHGLRQQLAASTHENKQLAEKVNGAKVRLESLLAQIPDEGA
jgi:cell division protein ZapB